MMKLTDHHTPNIFHDKVILINIRSDQTGERIKKYNPMSLKVRNNPLEPTPDRLRVFYGGDKSWLVTFSLAVYPCSSFSVSLSIILSQTMSP